MFDEVAAGKECGIYLLFRSGVRQEAQLGHLNLPQSLLGHHRR